MTYAIVAGTIFLAGCVVFLLRQGYIKEQNKRLLDTLDAQQNLTKEQNEITKHYDTVRAATPNNWDELRKKRARALNNTKLQSYSSRAKKRVTPSHSS